MMRAVQTLGYLPRRIAVCMSLIPFVTMAGPVDFVNDVMPLLSRLGCNGSACHGKAEGQNGLKLSVFEHDPQGDFRALTMESRGRRVSPTAPIDSLLLR